MQQLVYYVPMLGCDPEMFFASGESIVESEKVLPESGLLVHGNKNASKFTIDGVQAELNPSPNPCRANLANEMSHCFKKLKAELTQKKVSLKFNSVVKLTQAEMDMLSEKAKQFGCAPSTNVYEKAESKIAVNPANYLYRSAGGHIHMGDYGNTKLATALKNVDVLVPILDILLGNLCVLLDRDPFNIERRKVYGKPGEYRTKPYGLEYRTLSNFWLRAYPLMSLVMGMARLSVNIVAQSEEEYPDYGNGPYNKFPKTKKRDNYAKILLDKVKRDKVIKAISQNDFDLAYYIWKTVEDDVYQMIGSNFPSYPLSSNLRKEFDYFIEKGVDYWFQFDSLEHWTTLPDGHHCGWESFLSGKVHQTMLSHAKAKSSSI